MRPTDARPRQGSRIGFCAAIGCLALAPLFAACGDAELDDRERALLGTLRIASAALPPDPSNAVADDMRAAVLGKKLFFDPRYAGPLGSANDGVTRGSLGPAGTTGRVSCASCHQLQTAAGADHRTTPDITSLGAGYTTRNTQALINAALSPTWQFWDGSTDSLWSQALVPVESPDHASASRLAVAHLIYDHYRDDYTAVFGDLPDLSATGPFQATGKPGDPAWDDLPADLQQQIDRVFVGFGKAIEAYERLLTSWHFEPSAFDRYMAGDPAALLPEALRGARLFVGHAGCLECHRGPAFSDYRFHDIGTPQSGPNIPDEDNGRIAGVAVAAADPFNRAGDYSDDSAAAGGEVVAAFQAPPDQRMLGAFKTPTLRNASKTAPYMHDGFYQSLWDVVNHYNFGGATGNYEGTRDPAIVPLGLTDRELSDLVEFIESLEDGAPLPPPPEMPEGLVAPPELPP